MIEDRDDILAKAMAEARDDLVRRQARRAVDWTWGHQHQLDLESPTLGQSDISLVRWLFNRGGYQVGGGARDRQRDPWNAASDSLRRDVAPSMRMVVSLADLDRSRWVNLTGASGHAFDDALRRPDRPVASTAARCRGRLPPRGRRRRRQDAHPRARAGHG